MHGGSSRGPTTKAGLARCGQTNLKHGRYTKEAKSNQRQLRRDLRLLTQELKGMSRAMKKRSPEVQVPLPIIGLLRPDGSVFVPPHPRP
jgi:hypothetical protein